MFGESDDNESSLPPNSEANQSNMEGEESFGD